MTDSPNDSTKLPDWLKTIAFSHFQPSPQETPLSSRVEWPLLSDAAFVSGFLPEQLAQGRIDEQARPLAEQAVLGVSSPSYGESGPRWVLEDTTRVAVIGELAKSNQLIAVADSAARRLRDPLSAAIRDCLREPGTLDVSLPELERRRTALAWLTSVPGLTLPSIDEVDREIARRRMLADFTRMISRPAETRESRRKEFFFGRTTELQRLTDHVGAQHSVLASVTSFAARVVSGHQPVMAVWGVGGVGKTTLISKFMLRHAQVPPSERFPYAYIDFDRATVSARDHAGLLLEICSQVMSQLGELSSQLRALKIRVEDVALKMAGRAEGNTVALLRPCLRDFRKTVDEFLSKRESTFATTTPFLIVFDTFEIAQYTPDDLVSLEEFILDFSPPEERAVWPRLRLVISGRKRIERFLGPIERTNEIELSVLDEAGSVEMLMALASAYDKPITKQQARGLVDGLSRVAGLKSSGVQPLRLKLVGSLFKTESGTGSEIVAGLRKELANPLTITGLAGRTLIDGVLIRRVLEHVRDPRVKALADPGLVVRYITPDVIEHVMAPGTPDPTLAPGPGVPMTMWSLSSTEAHDIFKAFAREGTLVEPAGDERLQHRSDVRLEMLPLIRARSRPQFYRVHELAHEYFSARVREDTSVRDAEEAVYHGLWLARPLAEIDALWRRYGDSFDPRIEPEEFPDDSLANIYLRAKRGAVVAVGELERLPREVVLDWLDARGVEMLDQRSSDEAIDAMRMAAGHDFRHLQDRPSSAALLARLLYRAGFWQDSLALVSQQLESMRSTAGAEDMPAEAASSVLRSWATILAKTPNAVHPDEFAPWEIARDRNSGVAAIEVLAHMRLFAAARPNRNRLQRALPELNTAIDAAPSGRWGRELRILRLAILAGTTRLAALVDTYAQRNERLPRERGISEVVARVVSRLDRSGESDKPLEEIRKRPSLGAFERLDDVWRSNIRTRFLDALRTDPQLVTLARQVIVYDHGDWRWVLGNALSRELNDDARLLPRLTKERFIPDRRGIDPNDGLSIAQAAVDSGRLLEFAQRLKDWSRFRLYVPATENVPQDVYGIAAALLDWHAVLLRVIRTEKGSESGEPST